MNDGWWPDYVVCVPWERCTVEGTRSGRCGLCSTVVGIAPTSQPYVNQGVPIACPRCAMTVGLETAAESDVRWHGKPHT